MASSTQSAFGTAAPEPAGDAERERLLSAAVEFSPDAIITKTLEGIITSWNPAAERLFGYGANEVMGKSIAIIIPPDHREQEGAILARISGDERIDPYESVRVRKDGKLIDVSISISPVKSRAGVIVGATKVARDISERKLAEEKFRLAVEASPTGVVMIDNSGTILLVNAETEKMFGYRREQLVGQSVDMLVPLRFRGQHPQHREQFSATPGARRMGAGRDLFGLRGDGTEFPVEVGLNPIQSPDGLIVLAVIVDISERKRVEEVLATQTRELQRSNAELEQFAYVAAHDLQEPLRMVMSYAELLGERYRGQLDARADKYIHYAVEGAKRMQQLVNDLLAYSRVGTQGKPLRPTPSGAILDQVLRGLRQAIEEAGADVRHGALPTINADEVQLAQLFQNLVGNALKFRSERTPRVSVAAKREGGEWLFSVEDNGIGIEKEYLERVFQMFQRLNERGKYEGSGIGLAIAKRIVERHGGRIWFDSRVGTGTTFYFTLPVLDGAD
ncbi:MAG: sensor histidine kinase [Xanthobacteraceae bacterium]